MKNESVRNIEHKFLQIANYLAQNDLQLSFSDRQFLFQCRTNDTNVKKNRTWKYEETH